ADGAAPLMHSHIAASGCAVFRRGSPDGDVIVLADHGAADPVLATTEIPATLSGRHGGKVWNAMFAVAIARAMGASLDQVRAGLLAGGVTPDAILSIVGEEEALRHILAAAAPGDLVVVNTAEIDRAVAIIEGLDAGRGGRSAG